MSDKPIIDIRGVTKNYGPVYALERIDLSIKAGEFFSLLGPSGCGKSTLLRMLAGFDVPSHGEIYIDDVPMGGVPPHKRPVNIVFQSYALFPHLDVHRNIAFGMRKSGLSRREIDSRVDQMLETIKLHGYGKRSIAQLSGGERQRVALARALIKRPKVLLLDEPLSALDKRLREQMQFELRELQAKVGVTFVFVTHDQHEALTMSDRIAVMSKGSVHQVDTPEVIYQRPQTHFVADFIGTMNFFPGAVRGFSDGRLSVDGGPIGTFRLTSEQSLGGIGQEVLIAVRPERLSLSSAPTSNAGLCAKGEVVQSTYSGDHRAVSVRIPGMEHLVRLTININPQAPAASIAAGNGESVWISCDPDALLVIADTTSERESIVSETGRIQKHVNQ